MTVLSKHKNKRMNLKRFRQVCSKIIDKRLPFEIEETEWDSQLTNNFKLEQQYRGTKKISMINLTFYPKDVYTHKKKKKTNGKT